MADEEEELSPELGDNAPEVDRPVNVIVKSPLGLRIENEFLTLVPTVLGPGGNPVPVSGTGAGVPLSIMLMRGKDPSGDDRALRIDEQRLLRTRPFEPYWTVPNNPFAAAVGATTLLTAVPANISYVTDIFISATGNTTVRVNMTIGGITFLDNIIIPNHTPPTKYVDGFQMVTGDTAVLTVLDGTCSVWVNVKRFSTGDEPTGV